MKAVVILLFVLVTRTITVIIHEMGHAIAGLLLLKGDLTVFIGSYGDPSKGFKFKIGRLKIHFTYNPLWLGHGVCVPSSMEASTTRLFIFVLAGPLASFFTGLLGIYLFFIPGIPDVVRIPVMFLLVSSLLDFYQNIRSSENPIFLCDGTVTYNDGHLLELLWSHKEVQPEMTALQQFFANNEIEKGITYFNEVYSKKKNINLLRLGIAFHVIAENDDKVIALYDEWEDKGELIDTDYSQYALACSHIGQREKALELFNISLRLNPGAFYSLTNRGYTLTLEGRYQEAIKDFDQVIHMNHDFAYAYSMRGLAKIKTGKETEGLADIQTAMQLDDQNGYVYKNLGIYYNDQGEQSKALSFFRKAKEVDAKTHGINELIHEAEGRDTK